MHRTVISFMATRHKSKLVILVILKLSQNLSLENFNIKMFKRFPGSQEFERLLERWLERFPSGQDFQESRALQRG